MKTNYIKTVYNFLFYSDMKWNHDGPSQYYDGTLIHYSDFIKAKRGVL